MHANAETIRDTVYQALRTLNEERAADEQITIGPDTCLFGEGSALDSLALVSVIVDLETLVADRFGRPVSLTDDRAMSRKPVPFTSVATLTRYVEEQLN